MDNSHTFFFLKGYCKFCILLHKNQCLFQHWLWVKPSSGVIYQVHSIALHGSLFTGFSILRKWLQKYESYDIFVPRLSFFRIIFLVVPSSWSNTTTSLCLPVGLDSEVWMPFSCFHFGWLSPFLSKWAFHPNSWFSSVCLVLTHKVYVHPDSI